MLNRHSCFLTRLAVVAGLWTVMLGPGASSVRGKTFDVLHAFETPAINPHAGVIEGSDGAFYGTTYQGGSYDAGIVFVVNKDGTGFRNLHEFRSGDAANGANPYAGVIEGSDGALYGTTQQGGSENYGTVFKIEKDGTGYLKLHDFGFPDGIYPLAALIEGSDGALYGTTEQGGGNGIVFKLNKDGTGYRILHKFNTSDPEDGGQPSAGIVEGSDGTLYGTTPFGGAYGWGIVFKINKNGSGFLNLHDFNYPDGANGAFPTAGLVEATDGVLYGTTTYGGPFNAGILFRIKKDGTSFLNLHSFAFDGANPYAVLTEGSDGALYGTAYAGGPDYVGTVFKINKDGANFVNIHEFALSDGANPYAGVIEGSDSALYGTTYYGGTYNAGVVFKTNKDGSGFADVHAFSSGSGAHSSASLVEASDGALYGTTRSGGLTNHGIVFELDEDGGGFRTVHDFGFLEGHNPYAGVIEGSDGALYGTTAYGGTYDFGSVFKVNRGGTGFLSLYNFTNGAGSGAVSTAGLLEGSDGTLYGTTRGGGAYFNGTVFKINKDGSGFLTLHSFNYPDGASPYAAVVEGSDGALYGTTFYGGAYGLGVIFKLNKDGTDVLNLHDFNYPDGYPYAGLIEDSDGVLYGTTTYNGPSGVFRINKDGTGFLRLHSFNGSDGFTPYGGVVEGPNGVLYGTTTYGGANGSGIVFRLNKDGTGYENLHDFGLGDGANPYASLVEGSNGAFYGTTLNGSPGGGGVVFRVTVPCEASLEVQGEVHTPGSMLAVQVHIAHHRPRTVTVPWEMRLLDTTGQVIAKHTTAPQTFEPGDVVDREVQFQLRNDLASGTYTLELAIQEMAGTKGAATTFQVVGPSSAQ